MKKDSFDLLLQDFLTVAGDDHRIHPAHISLYVTLFFYWKQQQFTNPIDVCRDELMKRSKITGRTTYQRCLRELHERGYIIYKPTFNRFENAKMYLVVW
jgi:CDP-glycerol glycerophosphotransferase (TagB/SpsB family)